MILSKRSRDSTSRGFEKYEFMTMELWDESANGEWKFIADSADRAPDITYLEVVIRGTSKLPAETSEVSSEVSTKTSADTTSKVTTTIENDTAEPDEGITVEIKGEEISSSASTKKVTSKQVTTASTDAKVPSKVGTHIVTPSSVPSINAGHSGMFDCHLAFSRIFNRFFKTKL